MSMEQSISLEETNKIRISLGLKPLVDDGAPTDTKDKDAEDNYAETRERERKAKRDSEVKSRIDKAKNKRELHRRLVGATLGAEDPDQDDTKKWIKQSKKREKELAKKRLQELDNLDKLHQDEYTERDLEGLKVSHDLDALEAGEDRILTLKDSRILDNEEDELQNIDMAQDEHEKKRMELKTKRRDYTGLDDDEFAEGSIAGAKRNVLAKYDEDIDGPSETSFRLGGAPIPASRPAAAQAAGPGTKKVLLSIDYLKNQEISDYLQEGDVGFKKPKSKKKKQSTRKREQDPEDIPPPVQVAPAPQAMEEDSKAFVPDLDKNFVDDDDLQASLDLQRRKKLAKEARKVLKPEEIAKKLAQERAAAELAQQQAIETDEPAVKKEVLEFDETSEFVRSVQYTPAEAPPVPSTSFAPAKQEPIVVTIDTRQLRSGTDSDDEMEEGDEAIQEMDAEEGEVDGDGVEVKEEDIEEDETTAMLHAIEDAIKKSEGGDVKKEEEDDVPIGTAKEMTFRSGMASTMNILRQQGLLKETPEELRDREKTQIEKDAWLASHRHRLAERELDRLRSRTASNKDQAQREWENRQREQAEARENMEMFKDYKPDVDIKYHDETGRELSTKEAWKALSHKFHGKGSGKGKTEKRLKKIAEEKKREAMGSGDTPLSMQAAFQIRQERAGQAHMVLSVGNRGAVPQAAEFLDAPLTKKDKPAKSKKKDATAKSGTTNMTAGFSSQPLGSDAIIPAGASGAIISAAPTAFVPVNGSAAPPPSISVSAPASAPSGFKRIGAFSEAGSGPGSGFASPAPDANAENRGKVTIGFSAIGKRKSTADDSGAPSPKRR